jgi:hypothetical protein
VVEGFFGARQRLPQRQRLRNVEVLGANRPRDLERDRGNGIEREPPAGAAVVDEVAAQRHEYGFYANVQRGLAVRTLRDPLNLCQTNKDTPMLVFLVFFYPKEYQLIKGVLHSETIDVKIVKKIGEFSNDNVPLGTIKASNFGPHRNVGLFLASSVSSVDESCTKNEQNRICRFKAFLQLLFSSFFCRTRFNDSKPF